MNFSFLALILVLSYGSVIAAERESRTWTSSDGRTIEAVLMEIHEDGTLSIRRSDGFRFTIDRASVSPADLEYIEKEEALLQHEAIDWMNPRNAPAYRIKGVRSSRVDGYIKTDEGWEHRIEAMEVIFEYEGERDRIPVSVSAYFFDEDGRVITQYDEPFRYQKSSGEYEDPPENFEQGERYRLYFPISKYLEERDWKTFLFVVDGPDGIAAETQPRRSFEFLNFKKKESLFPEWDSSMTASTKPQGTKEIELEIKSVKRSKWRESLWFNGAWQKGQDCIEAEVKVEGGLPRRDPDFRLYLFNRENENVGKRSIPSMAHIGNREYTKVPKIAKEGDWYPVVFALDEELENADWRTAVVVFSVGDETIAEVYSRSGAILADLDFPEKNKISSP